MFLYQIFSPHRAIYVMVMWRGGREGSVLRSLRSAVYISSISGWGETPHTSVAVSASLVQLVAAITLSQNYQPNYQHHGELSDQISVSVS